MATDPFQLVKDSQNASLAVLRGLSGNIAEIGRLNNQKLQAAVQVTGLAAEVANRNANLAERIRVNSANIKSQALRDQLATRAQDLSERRFGFTVQSTNRAADLAERKFGLDVIQENRRSAIEEAHLELEMDEMLHKGEMDDALLDVERSGELGPKFQDAIRKRRTRREGVIRKFFERRRSSNNAMDQFGIDDAVSNPGSVLNQMSTRDAQDQDLIDSFFPSDELLGGDNDFDVPFEFEGKLLNGSLTPGQRAGMRRAIEQRSDIFPEFDHARSTDGPVPVPPLPEIVTRGDATINPDLLPEGAPTRPATLKDELNRIESIRALDTDPTLKKRAVNALIEKSPAIQAEILSSMSSIVANPGTVAENALKGLRAFGVEEDAIALRNAVNARNELNDDLDKKRGRLRQINEDISKSPPLDDVGDDPVLQSLAKASRETNAALAEEAAQASKEIRQITETRSQMTNRIDSIMGKYRPAEEDVDPQTELQGKINDQKSVLERDPATHNERVVQDAIRSQIEQKASVTKPTRPTGFSAESVTPIINSALIRESRLTPEASLGAFRSVPLSFSLNENDIEGVGEGIIVGERVNLTSTGKEKIASNVDAGIRSAWKKAMTSGGKSRDAFRSRLTRPALRDAIATRAESLMNMVGSTEFPDEINRLMDMDFQLVNPIPPEGRNPMDDPLQILIDIESAYYTGLLQSSKFLSQVSKNRRRNLEAAGTSS